MKCQMRLGVLSFQKEVCFTNTSMISRSSVAETLGPSLEGWIWVDVGKQSRHSR